MKNKWKQDLKWLKLTKSLQVVEPVSYIVHWRELVRHV